MSDSSIYPTDLGRIKQRIRAFEKDLQKKKRPDGTCEDRYGKSLMLGPLYMLAGDVQGALESYSWYDHAFPHDRPDPHHCLTWALALHHAGQDEKAFWKLYQTMFLNIYLVPHLLGDKPKKLYVWHTCNLEFDSYALEAPSEILDIWDQEAKDWARTIYDAPAIAENRRQYIEILRKLNEERLPIERQKLTDATAPLMRGEGVVAIHWKGMARPVTRDGLSKIKKRLIRPHQRITLIIEGGPPSPEAKDQFLKALARMVVDHVLREATAKEQPPTKPALAVTKQQEDDWVVPPG